MEEGNGGRVMDRATSDAIDRSLEALLGENDEDEPIESAALLWDGYGYRRGGNGRVHTDPLTGAPLTPQPIGVGWNVRSLTQRWILDDGYRLDRSGYCVDAFGDADGEPIFVCVEVFTGRARAIRRLDVGMDDVAWAEPADSYAKSRVEKTIETALGHQSSYQLHCSRPWLREVLAHLILEQRGR